MLEIGCGAGGGLSALHDAGFEVRGCDYSGELIEFGTAKGVPGWPLARLRQSVPRRDLT